jgi:hypothetical protein
MNVELALFDGDVLIECGIVSVEVVSGCCHLKHFHIAHHLEGNAAQIVLHNFSTEIKLKTVKLDMPIHQSSDWESIDLAGYTVAFRCFLNAQKDTKI